MKIAVWHNLPSGGGKRALHGQIVGLLARGHCIEVWCPDTADSGYLPLDQLTREHRLPFSRLVTAPGRLRRGWERLVGRNDLLEAMDEHCRRCVAEIAEGEFDLVFLAPCVFFRVPRLGRLLAASGSRVGKLPRVLYLQEPNRAFYEALPELPWLAPPDLPASLFSPVAPVRRLGDFLRNRELRRAGRRELEDARTYHRILVNSYFSRESVARAYGLDARVCYLGCDAERFRPAAGPHGSYLLGLGSMDYIKGVDTAIRAVAAIPAGVRPPLVWVANSGDPAYEGECLTLAAGLGVRLEVRRRVEETDLLELLQRARLLLYTSRLEPFGYAPLEAAACATPVVAVAEGGVRETVVDGVTGLLCERDPDALAAAMGRLLADEPQAERMGQLGRTNVRERWAMEASVLRLETQLHAVVNAPNETTP